MHARHRNAWNDYRSNSMVMGLSSSRISPETSGRGHGFYNSEYRSFKRGFGRGQRHPKSFQSNPPPPREGTDIFTQAGRLAAEYLVSQGLLPPSVLPAKWQNGRLKKQMGDYQDYRSQEGDNLHLPSIRQTSALARLRNCNSDVSLGRRSNVDENNSSWSRNLSKGRRKDGSYRGREYGGSGSWSDRIRGSPDLEIDDDNVSGHHEESHVGKDVGNGLHKHVSGDFAPKGEELVNFDDKYILPDELRSKASSSGAEKDLKSETDGELLKRSNDSADFIMEAGELKDGSNDNVETEEEGVLKDSSFKHSSTEDDVSGKTCTGLLALCNFAKVPTKTRSSLTLRNLKADSVSVNDQGSVSNFENPSGHQPLLEDNSLGGSSGDLLLNKSQDLKPDSELSKDLSVHSFGMDHIYGVGQGKCTRSQAFPDRALLHDSEQELVQDMPGLQRSCSMVAIKERGDKRGFEQSDLREGAKKPREWLESVTTKTDFLPFSDFEDKKVGLVEGIASTSEEAGAVVKKGIQDSLVTNSHFPGGDGESSINYVQEKQHFPNAFKICDLNLMETSDINESHHNDAIIMYSSAPETKIEAATIGIDLSMSNSNGPSGGNRHANNCKEIEVIDLENDCIQEDKTADNLGRKSEPMFVSMNGDMTDVPDQYDGLMMSEFFRNFSNCPPDDINAHPMQNENINTLQTEDINPLQSDTGLHNGEGTLTDDDSIYMSLGEIPLSFLPAWEQTPAQEYEKPF
ncbi:uncharacterized protein At4g26450-like isoform X1 [Hibiscus syriacus]|uniref:uncharacterized protein At4g26450-like isoform X1 n=1 Tax=Hibiscus syriacus TaxID=106335 RepID=UPI0019245944|nr:uncharacterized protein At4g26450-like isoform X1 [Hibiscus syriacus]